MGTMFWLLDTSFFLNTCETWITELSLNLWMHNFQWKQNPISIDTNQNIDTSMTHIKHGTLNCESKNLTTFLLSIHCWYSWRLWSKRTIQCSPSIVLLLFIRFLIATIPCTTTAATTILSCPSQSCSPRANGKSSEDRDVATDDPLAEHPSTV